jgi:hypothetical protein
LKLKRSKQDFSEISFCISGLNLTQMHTYSIKKLRDRTIPIERPQLLDDVSANFRGKRVPRGQRDESLGRNIGFLDQSHYFFFPSSSSIVLTKLSGIRSRPTTSQKNGGADN